MRVMRHVFALGACTCIGLVVLYAIPATSVGAVTPVAVACGATITHDTVLAGNVGPCAGTAITIGADNITLDLNGHSITGPNDQGQTTSGVRSDGHSGVTVRHGSITGFDAGVYLSNGSSETVTGLNLHDNIGLLTADPKNVQGAGIQLDTVHNSTISANTLTHDGPTAGIWTQNGGGLTISGNTLMNDNFETGGCSMCTSDRAIDLFFLENGDTVSGNIVINAGYEGIFDQDSMGTTISGNSVTGTGLGAPSFSQPGPAIFTNGAGTLITHNSVARNYGSGIEMEGDGDQAIANAAASSGVGSPPGIYFDLYDPPTLPPECFTHTWANNAFVTANQPCAAH